jgi:hypothetical protein
MRRQKLLAFCALSLMAWLASPAQASEFPYSAKIEVYMSAGAIGTDGLIDPSKVFVIGQPIGVNTQGIDLVAEIYAGQVKVASIGCHPGDLIDGRAVAYRAVSCDWKTTATPPGTKQSSLRAVTSVAFVPKGFVSQNFIFTDKDGNPDPTYIDPKTHKPQVRSVNENAQISATVLKTERIEPRPISFPSECGNVVVKASAHPTKGRFIQAEVYSWQKPGPTLDPGQVCVAATPRGGDVNGLEPYGEIIAIHDGKETPVATFGCGAAVLPSGAALQDRTQLYDLASCDYAPTGWNVPKGAQLRVRLGFFFGLLAPIKVGEGPVRAY